MKRSKLQVHIHHCCSFDDGWVVVEVKSPQFYNFLLLLISGRVLTTIINRISTLVIYHKNQTGVV